MNSLKKTCGSTYQASIFKDLHEGCCPLTVASLLHLAKSKNLLLCCIYASCKICATKALVRPSIFCLPG